MKPAVIVKEPILKSRWLFALDSNQVMLFITMFSRSALPTFLRHPGPHVVILDTQNFEISCAVAGDPLPWVTWMFDGEELQIINGTVNDTESTANKTVWWNVTEVDGHLAVVLTLHSNASTYGETGAYTCRANNSHGVVESQAAIVDVYGEWCMQLHPGFPRLLAKWHERDEGVS